jgi:hypothetical protein
VAKGKLAIAGLRLAPGELRLDGYVSRFDARDRCLIVSVESETRPNGKTRWTTKPEWRRVRFAQGTLAKIVGSQELSLEPERLEPGTPITVVAPWASGALRANSCLAQLAGLAPADLLASIPAPNVSTAAGSPVDGTGQN